MSDVWKKILVDKDVEVPMRDGVRLRADVFRPRGRARVPVIINMGPYHKDKHWAPPADLEEKDNPHMNWETANPQWWVPQGYALMRIDTRGSGRSPGRTELLTLQEAIDFFDAIEWAAGQGWCTGAAGTLGVSYHAINQWLVASLRPPSLKAIIPWEGAADLYRDWAYHGGLFNLGFLGSWINIHTAHHLLGKPQTHNPDRFATDWLWQYMRESLDAGRYQGRQAAWDAIDMPMLSAGNWSGMGLHLRGNTEAWLRAASPHKKLRLHAGTHFHPFHSAEGRQDQLRFFDHWLKGKDTGFMREPPVKLQIRTGGGRADFWRHENEWPLARTVWTPFYLQPVRRPSSQASTPLPGRIGTVAPARASRMTWSATGFDRKAGTPSWSAAAATRPAVPSGVSFETEPLEADTEITGPINLVLWVSSTTEDLDIYATLRNIDAAGNDVWEIGQQGQPVPVAKGWLRASHRKLDPVLSKPWRPWHVHDERQALKPGEVVQLQVEIWPTCMVFARGHRIRLDIQPRDGVGSAPYTHYSADYNTGDNTIHLGGATASYLLLPVIPGGGRNPAASATPGVPSAVPEGAPPGASARQPVRRAQRARRLPPASSRRASRTR